MGTHITTHDIVGPIVIDNDRADTNPATLHVVATDNKGHKFDVTFFSADDDPNGPNIPLEFK